MSPNLALPPALLLIITTAIAQVAPPPLPSSFYGTVQGLGNDLATNTRITTTIDGVTYTQITPIRDTSEWLYALDVPGDDPTTKAIEGGRPGDTVTFFVNDQSVATAEWQSGANTRVDLVVPELAPAQARGPDWGLAGLLVGLLVGLWLWQRGRGKEPPGFPA